MFNNINWGIQIKVLSDILEYLDEKTVGIGYKILLSKRKRNNWILRFYFPGYDEKILTQVIFPYCCNVLARVQTGFQMRQRQVVRDAVIIPRLDIVLTKVVSKRLFTHWSFSAFGCTYYFEGSLKDGRNLLFKVNQQLCIHQVLSVEDVWKEIL